MSEAVVVVGGVTYRGNAAARTIEPLDEVSALALALLDSGEPLGGVDELAVNGTWDAYPLSMLAAFGAIADHDGLVVTWQSDRGEDPPAGA